MNQRGLEKKKMLKASVEEAARNLKALLEQVAAGEEVILVEQDHRFPKKLAKYKLYFQYFHTAWRALRGYEIMNAIRKGQVQNIAKGDILGQRDFIHSLFGITV